MVTEDCRVRAEAPLVPPRELKAQMPSPNTTSALVRATRSAIQAALAGADDRLLVVVGPCSIHDVDGALEYAARLHRVAEATRHELLIVMRAYFEKPRTVLGWKGLMSDPRLDGSEDMAAGLALARSVLLRIGGLGLATGTEFLDPLVPRYVADLVAWGAIGARTTESQTHRMMASGLPMPVGFKNGTDGSVRSAYNAVLFARQPHSFFGIDADGVPSVLSTTGNPDGHIVLRGGGGRTNYHPDDVARTVELLSRAGVRRGVVVDCSHDNSRKDHAQQPAIFGQVVDTFVRGQRGVLGAMLESYLQPGNQTCPGGQPPAYGVSITDACIGWSETERLLYSAAERVAGMGAPRREIAAGTRPLQDAE